MRQRSNYTFIVGKKVRQTIAELGGTIPHGQCKAKEAAYVMTAGGYSEGMNYGYEYVKGLFTKLFSFEDVKLISLEGLDIFGNNPDEMLREAIDKL